MEVNNAHRDTKAHERASQQLRSIVDKVKAFSNATELLRVRLPLLSSAHSSCFAK